MDELKEAQERVEIGWNRDKARNTLAESMQTIEVAARLARKAVEEMEATSETIEPAIKEVRLVVQKMQGVGISSSKQSGTLSRDQARRIISSTEKLLKALDVKEIVKMSLDLTNQSKIFLEMMAKIDIRYGEEDRQRAEDITEHLTAEQLLQVYEWIGENKRVRADAS